MAWDEGSDMGMNMDLGLDMIMGSAMDKSSDLGTGTNGECGGGTGLRSSIVRTGIVLGARKGLVFTV